MEIKSPHKYPKENLFFENLFIIAIKILRLMILIYVKYLPKIVVLYVNNKRL